MQTYSNLLFLSGQALSATQLNNLSSSAAGADTIAAVAESAPRLPSQHDSKPASAAPSASRVRSEEDADHLSASASASRVHSEEDADHLSASASASSVQSVQNADCVSCVKAVSQLQNGQIEAEAASRLHSQQHAALDAETARLQSEQVSAAESVPRPQSEQKTACDAAASSASTSARNQFSVPRNFTLCDKVMPAPCVKPCYPP